MNTLAVAHIHFCVLYIEHCIKYRNFTEITGVEILQKSTASVEFRTKHWKFCGNCAFLQNFDTRILGEFSGFCAVEEAIPTCAFNLASIDVQYLTVRMTRGCAFHILEIFHFMEIQSAFCAYLQNGLEYFN